MLTPLALDFLLWMAMHSLSNVSFTSPSSNLLQRPIHIQPPPQAFPAAVITAPSQCFQNNLYFSVTQYAHSCTRTHMSSLLPGQGCIFYHWATCTKSTQLLTTVGLFYLSTYKSRVSRIFEVCFLCMCILLIPNTAWFRGKLISRKLNWKYIHWSWVLIKCLHPAWWKVTELWNLRFSWGDKAHIC